MRGLGALVGTIVGMLVGLIIVYVLRRYINTKKNFDKKYDERQELERGRGYKYAFYTLLFYTIFINMIKSYFENIDFDAFLAAFVGICIALIVHIIYCLSHDAYLSLQENIKRIKIVFVFIALFNYVIGAIVIYRQITEEAFALNYRHVNLVAAIFTTIVLIAILIHEKRANERMKREELEDELEDE